MPKNITQLTVFVSSPAGLDEDRQAVQSAVDEANKILSSENVSLTTFYWEKNSIPGRGGVSAQEVINKQLDDGTDILITLMHNRVGTATPSAVSGTIEEFDRVHRSVVSGANIEICIYFCIAPVSPLVDAKQLALVQEFRARVQSMAYLTRDYEKSTDLRTTLISHLVEKARALTGVAPSSEHPARSDLTAFDRIVVGGVEEYDDDEGLGAFELEEIAAENITRSGICLNQLAACMFEYTATMEQDTKAIGEMSALSQRGIAVSKVEVIDNFAFNLLSHLDKMEPIVIEFEDSFSSGASATLSMVQEWPTDNEGGRMAMAEFIAIVEKTLGVIQTIREQSSVVPINLQGFPGFTQKMKKARNRGVRVYSRLTESLDRSARLLSSAVDLGRQKANDLLN